MKVFWLLVVGAALGPLGLGFPDAEAQETKPRPKKKTQLSAELVDSLEFHEDLTYVTYDDGRSLELDLYRPKAAAGQKLPAIVCVHGGGWAKGNRKSHGTLAKALAAQGYVAVTISYRLSGEAPFPAQIHDCKAAVRWVRANAGKYGIDPGRIGAIGLSAGGHLVALLATSAGVEELEGPAGNLDQDSRIQAAVPMGAQTDLMSERIKGVSTERDIWQAFLSGSQAEQPENYRLASPLTHLDKDDPPYLFLSGEVDDSSTRAASFIAKASELGVQSSYIPIQMAPHAFLGGQTWFDFCIEQSTDFFDAQLKQDTLVP